MRLVYSLVFVITIYSVSLQPQEIKKIAIQDAVHLANQNNIQLKKQLNELKKFDGILSKASALPNPEASFFKEQLSDDMINHDEWTLAGTLPVNFLWDRWSGVNSASSLLEAEQKKFERSKLEIITEVKSAFVRYHYLNVINDGWKKTLKLIEQANQTAIAREQEGEISGYDQQRIQLEYLLYKKNETESRIALQNALKDLSLLIYPNELITDLQTEFNKRDFSGLPEIQNLLKLAGEQRADIQSAKLSLQSKSSQLSNEKLKIIPEVSLTLGYKEQSDNLNGLVYGLNLGIPLFNQNGGNIEIAEAELNQSMLEVQSIEKKIEYEVINSYNNLIEYSNQLKTIEEFEFLSTEEIINTAEYSYEEGEMSLVELIDALRAFTDAFKLKNELLINYHNSYYQLELAVGKEINQ